MAAMWEEAQEGSPGRSHVEEPGDDRMKAKAVDLGLLILRLAGLYIATHGWGKVAMMTGGQAEMMVGGVGRLGFPAPVVFAWAATLAEFAGGLFVAVGLFTRYAAGFAAFTMFVAAFFQHHAPAQFLSWLGIAPLAEDVRKGFGNPELAFVYLLIFLAVALIGPGTLSIDGFLAKRRE
jgi:putative oxidoreductase